MKRAILLGLLGSIVAVGAVVAGTVLRPGQWIVKKNAEVTMLALAAPECAVLILRCRASRPEVAMALANLGPGSADIALRIPGATADARAWRVTGHRGEVVYPGDAAALVQRLRSAPRVLADVPPARACWLDPTTVIGSDYRVVPVVRAASAETAEPRRSATFDLSGLEKALAEAGSTCFGAEQHRPGR